MRLPLGALAIAISLSGPVSVEAADTCRALFVREGSSDAGTAGTRTERKQTAVHGRVLESDLILPRGPNWLNKIAGPLKRKHGVSLYLIGPEMGQFLFGVPIHGGYLESFFTDGVSPHKAIVLQRELVSVKSTVLHEIAHAILFAGRKERGEVHRLSGRVSGLYSRFGFALEELFTHAFSLEFSPDVATRKGVLTSITNNVTEALKTIDTVREHVAELRKNEFDAHESFGGKYGYLHVSTASGAKLKVSPAENDPLNNSLVLDLQGLKLTMKVHDAKSVFERLTSGETGEVLSPTAPKFQTPEWREFMESVELTVTGLDKLMKDYVTGLSRIEQAIARGESGQRESREIVSYIRRAMEYP